MLEGGAPIGEVVGMFPGMGTESHLKTTLSRNDTMGHPRAEDVSESSVLIENLRYNKVNRSKDNCH